MATRTIKDLDDWIYARLRQRAREYRRGLVAEATVILEQALTAPPSDDAELLQRARQLREASSAYIASHETFQLVVSPSAFLANG